MIVRNGKTILVFRPKLSLLWFREMDGDLQKWQIRQGATMLSIALAPPKYEGGFMGKACSIFGLHWWQKEKQDHGTRSCKLCGSVQVQYYTKEQGKHWVKVK